MVEAIDQDGRSHADAVKRNFDFRPAAIIERLDLRRPIFLQTAAYGHFGKPGLPTTTEACCQSAKMTHVPFHQRCHICVVLDDE
jgi:S-adenosylmethionine synthetase